MMRLGFIIGFLIGAGVASLLSKQDESESPATEGSRLSVSEAFETEGSPLEQLREQAREAMRAGRQAADEKEAELLRRFNEATRPKD